MRNMHMRVRICLDHFSVHGEIEKQSLFGNRQTSYVPKNAWNAYILWVSIVQTSKVAPSS